MSLTHKSREERMREFLKEQEVLRQKKLAELELAQKRKEIILMKRIEEKRRLLQEKKSLEFQRQKAAELRRKECERAEMEKLMIALKRYSERQENIVNKNYYKPLLTHFGGKTLKTAMPNSNPCNSSSKSTVAFGSALILSHHVHSPHNGNKMMGKKSNQLMTRSVMHNSPSDFNNNSLKTYSTSVSQLPTFSKPKIDEHLHPKLKHSNSRASARTFYETYPKRPNFLDLASKKDKTNGTVSKVSRISSVKPSQTVTKSNTFVKSTSRRLDTESRHSNATRHGVVNTPKNSKSLVSVECHNSTKVTNKIKENRQKETPNDSSTIIAELSTCNSSQSGSCQDVSDSTADILNLYAILPFQPHFYIQTHFESSFTEEIIEIKSHDISVHTEPTVDERDLNVMILTGTEEIITPSFANSKRKETIEGLVTTGDNLMDKGENSEQSGSHPTGGIKSTTIFTEREAKIELALKRKLIRELALIKVNSDLKPFQKDGNFKVNGEEIPDNKIDPSYETVVGEKERLLSPTVNNNKEKQDIKLIQREKELQLEEVAYQKLRQINEEARQREEERKARKQKLDSLMSRTRPQNKLLTESFCPDSNCVITAYSPFSNTSLSTIKVQTPITHHSEDTNYIS